MKYRIGMIKKLKHIVLLLMLLASTGAQAQTIGIKSNLLYDAFANVNLGVEMGLAPKWTLDLSGDFNAWNISDTKKWKHWMVQPEARYWFCDRFSGHFLGVHGHVGQFNVGGMDLSALDLNSSKWPAGSSRKDSRDQGWFVGAGVGYGYSWILNRHWNLEAELGFGFAYTKFDRFDCTNCNQSKQPDQSHVYVGPTKAAINLIYEF